MKDPTLTVHDLLNNNWDNSNTSVSYDPNIHTGWVDTEASTPQVTVSTADELAAPGNQTPFSGIDPSGAGPTQDISGTLHANCWSSWNWESDVNPKKLTFEFAEEVERIVTNNQLSAADLQYIGYGGRRFLVDENVEPTVFRYDVTVEYFYENRP